MPPAPLVSVVTPVYNTEAFLARCIESVLAQTHQLFEYVVLDNASTDHSLEIARAYAAKDSRIRVIACDVHLPQIANYNRALSSIAPGSIYVKVVQADDWLFPQCIAAMAEVAEAHPQVGIVGSLHLMADGAAVEGRGLRYPSYQLEGKEVTRRELLEDQFHVLGTPTTLLYRADVVRSRRTFFPEDSLNSDLAAGFEILRDWQFGFVHQVLAWLRESPDSVSARFAALGVYAVEELAHLRTYGQEVLTADEFTSRRRDLERAYRRMIGTRVLRGSPASFWEFQRTAAKGAGLSISPTLVARSVLEVAWEVLRNPARLWAVSKRLPSSR
jgi:glycosyltransferase involved in cell wall biosynthesis